MALGIISGWGAEIAGVDSLSVSNNACCAGDQPKNGHGLNVKSQPARKRRRAGIAPRATQIAEQIEQHDKAGGEALEHCHALRHYTVEYRGFFRTNTAHVEVEVDGSAQAERRGPMSTCILFCENARPAGLRCRLVRRRIDDSIQSPAYYGELGFGSFRLRKVGCIGALAATT